MMTQKTPNANRLHIGIFGKRNAGKSTFINNFTRQPVSMVSPIPGTTTDPVKKAMELAEIGPVILYDTAGFDDKGLLGEMRIEKTNQIIEKCDLAILILRSDDITMETMWFQLLRDRKIPVLCIWNVEATQHIVIDDIQKVFHQSILKINLLNDDYTEIIRKALLRILPEDKGDVSIIADLASANDVVLLVMPQDIQAPKGRLILPQVQTIRDLLDHQCIVQSCTYSQLDKALAVLRAAPKLIISDSQIFSQVYAKKPEQSLLTSFSILFARYKGDIEYFIESASIIDELTDASRVLIMEACTHAPLSEDIGRVKLPALLRKRVGKGLMIDIKSGDDFPKDVTMYDLIIHCGACMFHRKYVLSRVQQSKKQHVPMTNYGIAIAYIQGILEHMVY